VDAMITIPGPLKNQLMDLSIAVADDMKYNQLKYFNEIAPGYRNEKEDGLSNCTFKELSRTNVNNQTHILVSI
jgi:hypothetical protein